MDKKYIELLLKFYDVLKEYHRHEIRGAQHIPKKGRAIVALNHSFATYDMFLFCARIYLDRGRMVKPMIDRLFYKIPYLREMMDYLGAQVGCHENGANLLSENEIVSVAPGGMYEAIRPSYHRYQIRWDHRKGFVKLAIRTQSPVILVACPKADDLYEIPASKITDWAYEMFRIPLTVPRGVGGITLVPKPIHLIHFVDKAVKPPSISPDDPGFEHAVEDMHAMLIEKMELLMARAVNDRGYKN